MLFKNSLCTSKRTPYFTITKINWLTLFKFKSTTAVHLPCTAFLLASSVNGVMKLLTVGDVDLVLGAWVIWLEDESEGITGAWISFSGLT
jgi:hypothetical protein